MKSYFLIFSLIPVLAAAADWPEFQGADRQNVWTETGILESFKPEDLKRKWSAPVAAGYSGPTVAEGNVYVLDRPDDSHERILCFDLESGGKKWEYSYDCIYGQVGYGYGPRSCVTVSDGRTYSMGTMGHLNCLDARTGEVIWSKNLGDDYKIDMPIWGLTSSPLVEGDAVIVQASAGPDGACIIAFHKNTGREIWRKFEDKGGYVSPLMIEQSGTRVLVVWTGMRIAGMNAATGEIYWEIPTKPNKMPINVPGPAFNQDRTRAFMAVFYDGSRLLKIDQSAPKAEELWHRQGINERKTDALHCMISPPFIRGDYIYGVDSYGQLRCLDMEKGDRVWEDLTATKPGRWSTIFMVQHLESGNIWMVNEQGELILAKLSPEGYSEISRATIIEPTTELKQRENGAVMWSPPAFANRCVFVKNDRELICIDLSAGG